MSEGLITNHPVSQGTGDVAAGYPTTSPPTSPKSATSSKRDSGGLNPDIGLVTAEEDDWNDNDSALGSSSVGSSTTSVAESILRHRQENGRTYHAYKEGKYIAPNDEIENDRLDLQHHLCVLTLEGKLHLCPAGKENVLHRVLDVGTGTGIWAIDFADEHPEAEVLGIDLSPIQPNFVPPNLQFRVDDYEEEWAYSRPFDFIYSRLIVGCNADWPKFFSQSYANLNPGGFIELFDACYPIRTIDDTFPPNSAIVKWSSCIMKALESVNRPADAPVKYREQLEAAGFTNIVRKDYIWPLNRWPKDPRLKEIGLWAHANVCDGLEGLSLAAFTRLLGWTLDETKAFVVEVQNEMRNTRVHAYMPIVVIYAQKPK